MKKASSRENACFVFNEWRNFVTFFADSPTYTLQRASNGLVSSARGGTVSENLINTGDRRHFISKKQCRKYNAVSMNGGSPNESNGD
jgi:hypothetical protein